MFLYPRNKNKPLSIEVESPNKLKFEESLKERASTFTNLYKK